MVAWAPGLSPPRFTNRPVPSTQVKAFAGSESGGAVEGVTRAPSVTIWNGSQVTEEASQTPPPWFDHSAGSAKSSEPSMTTPGPRARYTNGAPGAPEAEIVIFSRYVPGRTRTVSPGA